jgi:hypothetical protein
MLEEAVRELAEEPLERERSEDERQHGKAHQRLRGSSTRGGGGGVCGFCAPLKAASTCALNRGSRSAKSGLRTSYFL